MNCFHFTWLIRSRQCENAGPSGTRPFASPWAQLRGLSLGLKKQCSDAVRGEAEAGRRGLGKLLGCSWPRVLGRNNRAARRAPWEREAGGRARHRVGAAHVSIARSSHHTWFSLRLV